MLLNKDHPQGSTAWLLPIERSVVLCLLILALADTLIAQSPLQTVSLGTQQLELWTSDKGRSFDCSTQGFYQLPNSAESTLQQLKDSGQIPEAELEKLGMQYTRWNHSKRGRMSNQAAVLGFLLRNAQQEIAAEQLHFAAAVWCDWDNGENTASWPEGFSTSDFLLSEILRYAPGPGILTMLPITIPLGANSIRLLKGFTITVPVGRHEFTFTEEELRNNSRKSQDHISLVPLGIEVANQQVQIGVQLFRPTRHMAPKAAATKESRERQDLKTRAGQGNRSEAPSQQVNPSEIVKRVLAELQGSQMVTYEVRARSPHGQWLKFSDYQAGSRTFQGRYNQNMKREMTLRNQQRSLQISDQVAQKQVVNLQFEAGIFSFNTPQVTELAITVIEVLGPPQVLEFELRDINIGSQPLSPELFQYISELPRATSHLKPSTGNFRTWTDTTGRFQVEAELVAADNLKVLLKKFDGSEIQVPVGKLCEADREYLKKL